MGETVKNLIESGLYVLVVMAAIGGVGAVVAWAALTFGVWGLLATVVVALAAGWWRSAYKHVRDNGRDWVK